MFNKLTSRNFFLFYKVAFLIIFSSFLYNYPVFSKKTNYNNDSSNLLKRSFNSFSYFQNFTDNLLVNLKWEKLTNPSQTFREIKWQQLNSEDFNNLRIKNRIKKNSNLKAITTLNSLNRSIVFNNKVVGPDISWLVPPGLQWTKKQNWDFSTRGHNRRREGEPFLGWNGGDAVGQFYYHPISFKDYSFGFNFGMRSVYKGATNDTDIGEGLSMGFRLDKVLSENAGIAFGAEQLLQFDGLSDTGRDLYLTVSKGWWSENIEGKFPLNVATVGIATGKMAEGNIKGLCSSLFGGSGTEVNAQRSLCWAPVFSISRVFNNKFSSFFEYNSKWFLLGTSLAPFEDVAIRGTFAVQISDHIDNYGVNNFQEMKWVFRLSYGL